MELFLARQLSLSSIGEGANLHSREGREKTKHQNQSIGINAYTKTTDHNNDRFVISGTRLPFSGIQQNTVVLCFKA